MSLLMIVFNSLILLLLILLNHQHLPLGETTLQGATLNMKMLFFIVYLLLFWG